MRRRDFVRLTMAGAAALPFAGCQTSNPPEEPADTRNPLFRVTGIPEGAFTTGNRHAGVDTLIDLMGQNGLKFYRTSLGGSANGANGLIAADDVVLIKVNAQWKYRGCTNSGPRPGPHPAGPRSSRRDSRAKSSSSRTARAEAAWPATRRAPTAEHRRSTPTPRTKAIRSSGSSIASSTIRASPRSFSTRSGARSSAPATTRPTATGPSRTSPIPASRRPAAAGSSSGRGSGTARPTPRTSSSSTSPSSSTTTRAARRSPGP